MTTVMIRIDSADLALLKEVQNRTGGTMSDILRWALRWYAAGGPHRTSDDVLPDEILRILRSRPVGPIMMEGV